MFAEFFFMIFLTFLFIFIIGGSIIRGILGLLFGRRRFSQPYGQAGQAQQSTQQSQQTQSRQSAPSGSKSREKIFDKSDGEYVDFEEIKE